MKINLKATGIELTPAIADYAEKKILTLKKYLPKAEETYIARVELAKTTRHHKEGQVFRAEVQIAHGIDMYAAAEAEDLYTAIDLVEAEAARELQSARGKQMSLMRRGQRTIKDMVRGLSSGFDRFKK